RFLFFLAASFLICGVFYGRYAAGSLPVGADNSLMFGPFYSLRWDDGPPFYNPYSLGGSSLFTNLQTAFLYPLRWPYFFVGDWRDYFGLYNFLHYLIAFGAMAVFLRGWKFHAVPTLAGALVFACGGHIAGRIINPTIFYAAVWLPLLLYGAEAGNFRRRAALAGAAAMILATGSPHLTLYGLVGVFIVHAANPKGFMRRSLDIGLCLLFAFLIISPTFLSGMARAGLSIRGAVTTSENLADSMDWSEIPFIFLGGTQAGIFPEYIDRTVYIGPIAALLIISLFAARGVWRDRRFRCGLALTVAGVVFALGKNAGWQFVMPFIPGFNHLVGPSRALVLSAAGAALLAALALERFPWRHRRMVAKTAGAAGLASLIAAIAMSWARPTFEGAAPYVDEWLRAWLFAPHCLGRWLFIAFESASGLLLLSLLLLLFHRRPARAGGPDAPHRSRLWKIAYSGRAVAAALIALQLLHFGPRVAPPIARRSFFNTPPQAAFLQGVQRRAPLQPFRIVGYDPLRLHDSDFNEAFKFQFLMPNLASLYGLEDIQGFDPLISQRYCNEIAQYAGRAPVNDPLRVVTIAAPNLDLFDILGVRFLIGHPYNRRLTHLPQTLRPGAEYQSVAAFDSNPTTAPITRWLFVSLVDSAVRISEGAEIGRLEIEAAEGNFTFPVRYRIETAHLQDVNDASWMKTAAARALINTTWEHPAPIPSLGNRVQFANYRGMIVFERPLTVKRAAWRLVLPRTIFNIAGQACRLASPAQEDDPWRLVWGAEDDAAPIFEYKNAKSRAVILPKDASRPAGIPGPLWRRVAPSPDVQIIERHTNSLRVRARTTGPALLGVRENTEPLAFWHAEIGGKLVPVRRGDNSLLTVEIPAGESEVHIYFRPTLLGIFSHDFSR
ncbi:MAG: hypothetical protein NTX50_11625, partial [Candidatus Sumerlaeota bacterium]|nr:hypothetical protein [Candidatus Sumerlaeota bacterium]